MQQIAQTAFEFKTDAPSPLEVFKARAETVAKLLANHMLADKASAADGLWRFAEAAGLVPDARAQDEIQRIIADAFRRTGK
jgi:hypothetical protein